MFHNIYKNIQNKHRQHEHSKIRKEIIKNAESAFNSQKRTRKK